MKYTVVYGNNEKAFAHLTDAINFAQKISGVCDIFYGEATHVATYMNGEKK